jgi:hypothetical protein
MPSLSAAQIVINEVFANPLGSTELEERVEIYNAGGSSVDVTGWAIEDAATFDNQAMVRCRLPEDFDGAACPGGAVIAPGEFRLVKGQVAQAWLNNSGDDVYLTSNRTGTPVVIDLVTYPLSVEDSSWAALPNGSENFAWRTPTLCATNGNTGDIVAPAAVNDLAATPGLFPGEIRLTWTAPGDDGMTGTASAYEIKVAHSAISEPSFGAGADLERWINEPLPQAGGVPETLYVFGLDPDSTYYFALKTLDEVPNTSAISNSPSSVPHSGLLMNPDLGFSVYFGNLHSHTGYSDGAQTPADAYNYARNTAPTPLDFLAVTDHNHSSAGMSLPDYHQGLSEAAAANSDGNFVAIYGQEWGLAANGHVNVFESPALFGWENGNFDVFVGEGDYPGLYSAALANPPSGLPVVAEWCHPATGDFSNMTVTPDAFAAVHLMAIVNGPAQSTVTDESDVGNTGFDDEFQAALRLGMRVSPTADQDNHNATWGASTQHRTAVLATSKTKLQILSALAARRNYATQDHDAVVDFSADGHAMGEAFASGAGIRIAVQVSDPAEQVAMIELFRGITGTSLATRVAYNTNRSSFQWRELASFAPLTEAHYYLRIRSADNQFIWTGPVYVTYDPSIPAAVGDDHFRDAGLALAASPNPAAGRLSARFVLPRSESRVTLAVYDPSGRRVRVLLDRALEAGTHLAAWDGRSESGQAEKSGIFFLRLETRAGSVAKKIVFLQ